MEYKSGLFPSAWKSNTAMVANIVRMATIPLEEACIILMVGLGRFRHNRNASRPVTEQKNEREIASVYMCVCPHHVLSAELICSY